MKNQPLLAIALLFVTTISGFTRPLSEERPRNRLQSRRSGTVKNMDLTRLDRAYLDTYGILSAHGQCGSFFGGGGSLQVLDELVIRLQDQTITDTRIAIRMWGTFTTIEKQEGTSYRLFEQAQINSRGAFYRSKAFPAEPLVPKIGGFPPNSRGARVLILLHELAHLIKGKNGTWLIPDDGNSPQLSSLNTLRVDSQCGQQIRAL